MKVLIIIIIVLLLLIGGYFYFFTGDKGSKSETINSNIVSDSTSSSSSTKETDSETELKPSGNVVEISENGFSPSVISINQGDSVIFQNVGKKAIWPASDVHPKHTVYPGSDIKKCNTAEASRIFDACRGIAPEGIYTFTFTERGSWEYHDHLSPRNKGTIIVN